MDKKTITIIAVVAVAIIAVAAVAFVMLGDKDKGPTSASAYVDRFIDNYDETDEFGEFKMALGSDEKMAIMTSLVPKYIKNHDEETSSNTVYVYYFKDKNEASAKFDLLVSGMSTTSAMTVKLVDLTLTGKDAKEYGCDKITMSLWSRNAEKTEDNKQYTIANGVALQGNYVIDFSQVKEAEGLGMRLYFGLPTEETLLITEHITLAEFEDMLKTFFKAFL